MYSQFITEKANRSTDTITSIDCFLTSNLIPSQPIPHSLEVDVFHSPSTASPVPSCNMNSSARPTNHYLSLLSDPKCRTLCIGSLFTAASLLCVSYFVCTAVLAPNYKEVQQIAPNTSIVGNAKDDNCKDHSRPSGSEALPRGIVSETSNLDMRPLWLERKRSSKMIINTTLNSPSNLFTMAVGIKQQDLVDKMVKKFLASDFAVMLFHYDGMVDAWKIFEWSGSVIHVSANNQTKWWFAKRFLHPDIVAVYDYIFLWDEDLGIENFHPKEYVSIIKCEGLEISQPALDANGSEVHHQITVRGRSKVHRRTYKAAGSRGKGCDDNSTSPPCTGWIEMMAPVFSNAAWRCVWYMIQNDLIHAWGLDVQLGYCAQGDRTKKIGVVDSEYVVHHNLPTLGGSDLKYESELPGSSRTHQRDHRVDVRMQSLLEYDIFRKRWQKAAVEDKCWINPYEESLSELT